MRAGPGPETARVGADQTDVELRGDTREIRVKAAPRVIEHIGAGSTHLTPHLRAPGIDTYHEVRELGTYRTDEVNHAIDLVGGAHCRTGTCLDTPDINDLSARRDNLMDALHCRLGVKRRAAVVEGIGSAVHDCHDRHVVRTERPRTPAQPATGYLGQIVPHRRLQPRRSAPARSDVILRSGQTDACRAVRPAPRARRCSLRVLVADARMHAAASAQTHHRHGYVRSCEALS